MQLTCHWRFELEPVLVAAREPRELVVGGGGNRIGLITNTGGPAVIATDILVGAGAEIPPLSAKTENLLKESGRGIFILRSIVDDVQFFFSEKGTEVKIVKNCVLN